MLKNKKAYLFHIVFVFLMIPNVYAAGASGIEVSHCTECGKVLVGAVRIEPHSIQWQGIHSTGIQVSLFGAGETDSFGLGSRTFGFTGSFDANDVPDPSLINYNTSVKNEWNFISTGEIAMNEPAPNGGAPSIGFYFSPSEAKSIKSSAIYSGICSVSSSCQNVYYSSENAKFSGEGIGDNLANPALTLDVGVNNTLPIQSDISVSSGSTTAFAITPKLNKDNLPKDVLQPEYVEIFIKIDEINTGCKSTSANPSFRDKQDTLNDFSLMNYYHYLKVEETRQCSRIYSYLVSVNRSFNFEAVNQTATADGYAQYSFFIKGHYNPYSPVETDYPGSHHTFRLRTSNVAIPTTNKLTVNVTGNGTVISNDNKINCPTNCSSDYNVNTPVTLTATPNTNAKFSGWSGNCSGISTTANIILDANKNCTATFSDTTSTPDTFNLQAIVNNTAGGKIAVNSIVCTQSCTQQFPKNANVTLVAEAETGYTFDSWTGTNQCEGKKTTSLTVMMSSDQTCTAIFAKETVVALEKACFNIDYVNDPDTKIINRVKLDAACSGVASSYNWLIYPLNDGNPVSNSGASFTTNKLADGNYTVTLIIGEDEAQNQISQNFTIPPLLAKFEIKSDAGKLTLDASTTSKAIDSGEVTYRWWSSLGQTIKNGITAVVDYTTGILDVIGKYETITLTVTDEKGRISSTSQKAKVNTAMPVEITNFDIHSYIPSGNNTMIVTLCAQAQDPDGGEIAHEFKDSYGTSIQGVLTEEKDEQCLEADRLKAQFTYTTLDNTQPVIADTYYLDVVDNEGTKDDAILHIPMPTLGANAINNKGDNTSTTSLFYGGISNENGISYKKELSVKSTDTMSIRGYFKTDTTDIGEVADILLVIGYEIGADTSFFSFSNAGLNPLKLDGTDPNWVANLSALTEKVTLDKEILIAIPFTGTPKQFFGEFKGNILFYLGYRLNNGNIVYSFPITLTILP